MATCSSQHRQPLVEVQKVAAASQGLQGLGLVAPDHMLAHMLAQAAVTTAPVEPVPALVGRRHHSLALHRKGVCHRLLWACPVAPWDRMACPVP